MSPAGSRIEIIPQAHLRWPNRRRQLSYHRTAKWTANMSHQRTLPFCFLPLDLPSSSHFRLTGCSLCTQNKPDLVILCTLKSLFISHKLWLLSPAKAQWKEGETGARCHMNIQHLTKAMIALCMKTKQNYHLLLWRLLATAQWNAGWFRFAS